ncbi:MAG: DUF4038 domain-containing protein [Bryobacteraceae bacterium]
MILGELCLVAALVPGFSFVHPGLLHTRSAFDRMKAMVAKGEEPWKSGFEALRSHPQSQAGYVTQGPFAEIGRAPNVHFREFDQDANAAYQNAVMWQITGEAAHVAKSAQILDGWCSTLEKVTGADAVLMAGLGPFKMVNAAEILRHTDSGWPEASARRCEQMFRHAVYPAIKDFALFANGNWDTAAIKTMAAIGVYTNDRAMFERALRYYVDGEGNGRLTHYIFESGQSQESGRDQAHTQLGLGHLADTCEIAWNQGLDLYGYADNRLLRGFEYTARYLLGEDVPFAPVIDRTGKYRHEAISGAQRGRLRPVFEQVYNHYAKRRGVPAPWTEKAAAKIRPEGPAQGADHPGFGTILFSLRRVEQTHTAPPAALIAKGAPSGIVLSWVAPVGARTFTVRRATANGGPYRTIAEGITAAGYTDTSVRRGQVYCYSVSGSSEACTGAGLPSPWEHADIGAASPPGMAAFDGETMRVEGALQPHFAFVTMDGGGAITARVVPPFASQSAGFGLMMRETLAADSAHAALRISREGARWQVQLSTGDPAAIPEAYVRYGRFMEPYWLRLSRAGGTFTGAVSPDGQTWTAIGTAAVPLKPRVLAGLIVSSGIPGVRTSVAFDHVAAPVEWLSVSPNGRFLQTSRGKPFFWLGDTAWLLFKKLDRADAGRYLEDRRRKGFNVIQAMVLHDASDRNVYGAPALDNADPARPVATGEYSFWDHVDWIVDAAAAKGLYMALVPAWGSNARSGALNANNVEAYARFLAARYGGRPNIIWMTGGDTRGDQNTDVWRAMGRTLKALAPRQLVTFHPFGRTQSSTWFHDEPWLDFNMFQSGHRRYDQDDTPNAKGEDNWRYAREDLEKRPPKPTIDGEPSYEGIPQGLHDSKQPLWTAREVRRYAWWSVLAGAFGHTYGHAAVMQMSKAEDPRNAYGVRRNWFDALNDEGAGQMRYVKELLLSRPFFERVPDQGLVAGGPGKRHDYVIASRGNRYAFIYTYAGRPFDVRMGRISGQSVRASWYDPRTGDTRGIGRFANRGVRRFTPPARDYDWVLVLDGSTSTM